MGTQGIVSLVRGGKVVYKVIAGCNGMNARAVAEAVLQLPWVSCGEIYEEAACARFGSEACLVVQSADEEFHFTGGELGPRYREKFSDPAFNPRWERGTAAHVLIVDLDKKTITDANGEEDSDE